MSRFTFNFMLSHLQQMIPGNNESAEWYEALCAILPKYDITTPERVVGFVTQCAHESNNFRSLEENLNYTADTLVRVFRRYFTGSNGRNPKDYARNPEKLANYVYMDRYRSRAGALGNIQPGDGWRFKGRGIKQLTGRNNYAAFGKTVGMTAEQAAEYVATKKGALESACWFWSTRNLNRFADRRDIIGLSRAINGGDIGLADRRNRWDRGLAIVNAPATVSPTPMAPTPTAPKPTPTPTAPSTQTILRRGSSGSEVIRLQRAIGIAATGIFGPETETAVRQFQLGAGLTVDGIAGPQTLGRLLR
jgi:putative chitinase